MVVAAAARGEGSDRGRVCGSLATAALSGLGAMWRGRESQNAMFVVVSVERRHISFGVALCPVGSTVVFFI
jgi:hypothetical protein